MKFELYQDKRGEYRWRLKAANGNIMAVSSEGYKEERKCRHAIQSIQNGASGARVNVKDP